MVNLKNFRTIIGILAICSCLIIVNAAETDVDPTQPRSCYSCSGINCYRTTAANATVTCTDGLDICVTIFEGFGVLARGCFLDIADEQRSKCEGTANKECHKCFGQLCNNLGREDFMCYECDGSTDCTNFGQSVSEVRCPAPTSANSYCYVERKTDGTVVRGCSTSTSHQRSCFESKNCALCLPGDKSACNDFKLVPNATNMASRSTITISFLIMIFVKFLIM